MRARAALAAGALAGVLVLAGCTPDEEPTPGPSTAAPSPQDEQEEWTPEQLAAEILDAGDGTGVPAAEPVASASGTVTLPGGTWEAQVDVLSVVADATGTDLSYALRSPDGATVEVDRFAWGDGREIWDDTRAVALIDPETQERLLPYTGYASRVEGSQDLFCACSQMPGAVGEGDVLGALLPPLSAGAETVTVELPGFAPITDVPVTWR